MPQWSKRYQETQNCKTEDGRDYLITRTFVNKLKSMPFQPAIEEAVIVGKLLLNIEVSGDILEDEAAEILMSLRG